jgi:archaellum component FlaF (FlaF/FlaG flagellin family)
LEESDDMALNNPLAGINSTSEFQLSGLPWVVSGTTVSNVVTRYQLPKVTKSITIHNLEPSSNKKIRIGFTENGVNGVAGNYFFVFDSGALVTLDARVKEFYIRADTFSDEHDYSIYCSLTTIASNMMPILTGSTGGETLWNGVG